MRILEEIIKNKKKEIYKININNFSNLKKSKKSFSNFIKRKKGKKIKLIGEIKKKSPIKGEIFIDVDILKLGKIYSENGASAISVLTDKLFFGGSLEDLKKISKEIKIPILRKDFILNEKQIFEARFFGADAILLMTQILTKKKIKSFIKVSKNLGMDAVVEVFSNENLEIALECGAKIILVNSRDFLSDNLKINHDNFQKIIKKIPKDVIKIAASGFNNFEKLPKGYDAILIGSHFMELKSYQKIKKKILNFTKK